MRKTRGKLQEREFYKYLYETYYASLCHYARRILNGVVDEEDVVQDVFVRLWERRIDGEEIRTLASFLYRAVHNSCLTELRDRKEMRVEDVASWDRFIEDDPERNEQMLIEEEYYRLVHQMIHDLPQERRDIMLLALEGKKNEDIAAELDISVNTVKTLKKRAYTYLREHLPERASIMLLLIMWKDF